MCRPANVFASDALTFYNRSNMRRYAGEMNHDGFWDGRSSDDPYSRRQVLRGLDRDVRGRPQSVTEWVQRHHVGVAVGAVAVALSGLISIVGNLYSKEPPDISEYRPERVNARALSDVNALRIMGLCEPELRTEASLAHYIELHGQTSVPPATTRSRLTAAELNTAANLARDAATPCDPGPSNDPELSPGAYRLPIKGGDHIAYPYDITEFSASSASACGQLVEFNRVRLDKTYSSIDQAVAERSLLLEQQLINDQHITCPALLPTR